MSHALKLNPYLTHLSLENNQLNKGDKFHKITFLLKSNKILKSLNLSKCDLDSEDAEALAEGLYENTALTSLNLAKNKIMTKGAIAIFESLRSDNTRLSHIDLSSNNIENDAIVALSKTLESNSVLQKINLYNNMVTDVVGRGLAVAIKNNRNLHCINLGHNSLERQDLNSIKEYCQRNVQNAEKNGLPVIREQLIRLMQSEEGVHLTEEQLHRRITQCQEERSQLEQEFHNGQDRFDRVKVKQDSMYAYLKEQRDLVHEQLDKLEEQEFQMEGMHHSIKKKFDEDMEDFTLKISKLKNLEKQTRGVIQQHLDKIEIKNRDNLVVIQKQQREVDRVSKKMLIKKLEFENMERAVEDLRAEVLRIEQEKEGAEKTLSTLKRTRTSYYKPNKSVNKSP